MAYIEIENLKYRYPRTDRLALDGITLKIEKGSFLGIIGKNGSGKSTLASAIIGLVPQFYKGAYGGSVRIDGLDAAKVPVTELARKVGLVFQNPFNQLSGAKDKVYDEVCFGMQNFAIAPDEMARRADDILKRLGIYEFRDRNPFDLSGGQMQRVAIASILVLNPDVIILDEPTSQLDPAGSEEVFRVVEKLRESGITVIMIEQKIDKIADYSDSILLLDDGRMIAYGSPSEVLSMDGIESHGVLPPAVTRISRKLSIRKPDGYLPVNIEEAGPLMKGRIAFRDISDKSRSTGPEMLRAEDLFFHYREGLDVLKGVNLSFDARPTAIIGQNGAGKTTLAKLMKGLLKPSSGKILFKGKDTAGATAASLAPSIGYVFQNPDDQIFKPRVIDEVMFGPLNIGMAAEKAKEKASAALHMVKLDNAMNRNPYDLDLHERKMVALASVIAMEPDVIILDEPTIAQDDRGKDMIRGIIKELHKNGMLVISILHDMDLVALSFDRVIVMAHGQVIKDGSPREVFSDSQALMEAGLELPHVASLARALGDDGIKLSEEEFLSSCTFTG